MTCAVVLVAGSSVGAAWVARRYVTESPRFAVASFDVTGNEQRTTAAIITESGLTTGVNAFAVNLDGARARLLGDPWILDASLTRRLPRTISIQVLERRAAAIVTLGDTFLATSEGEPFKKLEPGDPVDLPVITGISPQGLADDREGAVRDIRRAIDLSAEYGRGEMARRAPLEEVHVGPDGALTVVVGHGGTQLVLGGPPFQRKLERAARIFGELDRRGARADAIMLDNEGRPERVVARMR